VTDRLISIKIDNSRAREALQRFPAAFGRAVDPAMWLGAKEIARIARALAPKAFSTLINSIDARKAGPLHYEVAPAVNYARPVEEGVKGPMARQPGTANGLEAWIRQKTGETDPRKLSRLGFVIARSMKAKGIRAQPYLAPAAEQGTGHLTTLVAAGVAQAVREIFG
jgi:hypothetical protein